MRQIENKNKRRLYFPRRITDAMGMILDYPLIIIEAPMGYGKTTAVREHVGLSDAGLLWQNIYDESKAAFWSGFCGLFEEFDAGRSISLLKLGYPDDSVSTHAALELIKAIDLPIKTVVVIDDFHLLDAPDVAGFITLLSTNGIKNLHIVLVSRFFNHFNTEELSLKGYLYHIKKDVFEFSKNEIVEYYKCCGIALSSDEADELYSLTEGWISAIYLLMLNYKEGEKLSTSVNIYNLTEQTVYNPLSETVRQFLLSMSVYSSFTREQAAYMMPHIDVEKILNEITGGNSFIMYDPVQKSYHIHSILKNFLTNKLNAMQETVRTALFDKASKWYFQSGEYLLSLRYSYLAGDFDSMMRALELDKGHSFNGDHKESLIKYFEECPFEHKVNHPYAVLIFARRMFMINEMSLFRKSCEAFMEIYQSIETGDADYKNRLLGEYELLMSFTEFNDIENMSEYHKRAYELLVEPSLIFDKQSSWTYGSPSVMYLFYRKSGDLLGEVHTMRRVMKYYYQITCDHGKGAEDIMSAERFYCMGDFLNAEIDMHKAYQTTAESTDVALCAIFLNIRLCLVKGDFDDILKLFSKLRENIFEKQWHIYMHTIDICEAYVYTQLNMNDKVAPWIRGGEFKNVRLLFPSLSYLNIIYGRVLVENDEYEKLIGRSEEFLNMAGIYPNLLAQIYTYIYIAAASDGLSRGGDACAALKNALDIAMPDKVYMPFVENGNRIKHLLEELRTSGVHSNDIAQIQAIYKKYNNSVKRLIRENTSKTKETLTERESEIARLAAQGLSNKEIGLQLFISENTVKTQLKSVFLKLKINSRALLRQKLDP